MTDLEAIKARNDARTVLETTRLAAEAAVAALETDDEPDFLAAAVAALAYSDEASEYASGDLTRDAVWADHLMQQAVLNDWASGLRVIIEMSAAHAGLKRLADAADKARDAEIAELREALKPFAAVGGDLPPPSTWADSSPLVIAGPEKRRLTFGDFRRARALISKG